MITVTGQEKHFPPPRSPLVIVRTYSRPGRLEVMITLAEWRRLVMWPTVSAVSSTAVQRSLMELRTSGKLHP